MLIEFKVGNYLSFNEVQVLRIGRKGQDGNYTISKNGFVFGPNGSGKSNLIKAINTSASLVNGTYKHTNSKSRHLDKMGASVDDYSYFEYVLQLDGRNVSYGFEINLEKGDIRSEWLIEIGAKERCIFEFLPDSSASSFPDLRENDKLYLRTVALENGGVDHSLVASIRVWFSRIRIKVTNDRMETIPVAKGFADSLKKQLSALDTGITEVILEKLPEDSNITMKAKENRIVGKDCVVYVQGIGSRRTTLVLAGADGTFNRFLFRHGTRHLANIDEESLGTSRMIRLLAILSSQNIDGECGLVCIDEIECSIHTLAMVQIMDMFMKSTPYCSQIVVTTHESRLMDLLQPSDADIWFVDYKDNDDDRMSVLYSLSSFKGGFTNYERMYMDGKFSAVPAITPLRFGGDERC